ncbi:ribosomal protein S18-alanine N-acetyltransferase [Eubacteriales bacterium OttesenSCG-928-K08]|nr:ribosomal protein S18-alanine N-acetyltransferase [Eubacteriales bacterium OttesenSCG-928-K08]
MQKEPLFRKMKKEDVPGVAEIESICFRSPWTKNMLYSELKNAVARYFVLEAPDGALMGYIGMWLILREAHVTNVAVLPQYRRQGWGRKIMLFAMEDANDKGARQMTLEVRESNIAAQAMYEKLGFTIAGRRKKYYSDTDEDALVLWNMDIEKEIRQLRA